MDLSLLTIEVVPQVCLFTAFIHWLTRLLWSHLGSILCLEVLISSMEFSLFSFFAVPVFCFIYFFNVKLPKISNYLTP